MYHGPIAFCVAWRESGSKSPPQESHRFESPEIAPQYGQSTLADGLGAGFGRVGSFGLDALTSHTIPTPLISRVDVAPSRRVNAPMRTPPLTLLLVAALLNGCASNPSEPFAALAPTPDTARQTPAFLGATPLQWNDLAAPLAEAAGRAVVEELAITHAARGEAAARGVTISDTDLARERDLLLTSLTPSASSAQRARLADRVRRERGLGPTRFALLVERNALLRAMVRDQIEVTPADMEIARDATAGERRLARVITVPDRDQAARLRDQVIQAEDRRATFIELAVAHSTDPTATRGGLTEPIGLADPAYPERVRRALTDLRVGEVSPVIAVERGFVVLMGEGDAPPVASDGRPLEESVRLAKERIAMDRLAARLLQNADVRILDPSLRWSWESR